MDMTTGLTYPKPEPRKRTRARKQRVEQKVKKSVRAQVFERDAACRMASVSPCEGPDEWCHAEEFMRSRTRGQAPEIRHQKRHSFRGCQKHHAQYDGRSRPRIGIMFLTAQGADGDMLCAEQLS